MSPRRDGGEPVITRQHAQRERRVHTRSSGTKRSRHPHPHPHAPLRASHTPPWRTHTACPDLYFCSTGSRVALLPEETNICRKRDAARLRWSLFMATKSARSLWMGTHNVRARTQMLPQRSQTELKLGPGAPPSGCRRYYPEDKLSESPIMFANPPPKKRAINK